jgi:hypothetical protein
MRDAIQAAGIAARRAARTAWAKTIGWLQPVREPSVHDIIAAIGDTGLSEPYTREAKGTTQR